jgi:microcystin-dependent protein
MSQSYRGIAIPDPGDWADIEVGFKNFLDAVEPVGIIKTFAGNVAPAGYLLCDGTAIPAGTAYDALRNLIGANTPDLRGKAPMGAGQNGVNIRTTGGEATHVLSAAEMPAHAHGASTDAQGNHYHPIPGIINTGSGTNPINVGLLTRAGNRDYNTDWAGQHAHNVSIANAGGGGAHNNMSPYYGVNFIIKF